MQRTVQKWNGLLTTDTRVWEDYNINNGEIGWDCTAVNGKRTGREAVKEVCFLENEKPLDKLG